MGHYLSGGKCARCDGEDAESSSGLRCHKCTAGAGKPECSLCAPRHGLFGGECVPCLHSSIRRTFALTEEDKGCANPVSPIQAANEVECGDKLEKQA